MHTLKLNVPDSIYVELMSFLKKYPNLNSYIVEDENKPDFTLSSIEEVRKRVEKARASIANGNYIEENQFWSEVDKHINKL
ncbi:MAG: hypothetical protein A3E21_06670 [Sulfurimonas sp. RIFCSPHIGHO2_12_FULL_36_9]|uniref:hypothetical protein n=1 Tax=Sulfurimonas sp. RIFCSPLOWO2_12_36_12 TaxID=1802253 RepID=UPI0008BAFC74|nr:hypothetical protein [Sulfurimonas sp. RIFCSPLOWO2_12_36_12]OHD97694.1 MAG: hypothetical protein A3J26_02420 [Sulfurimonas sp. RIFCSPLOWO2_02_FULL_36_28]OHD99111.1 MAG: hypothetical protein A3E21_06670 [Sulfurimonas sp. RIFCSPHIGHO2_12_FULL_36_9]OHE02193.1 MAG: hypothetical protein A2W82_01295 [Sulfurimonas sp. RIFCSPLOWO2_12_36_12]OHE06201.1 MAG: hypothetical protein A3K14_09305 [Sulfurimonas sp. RIFCSPLOWO2_12_FULL_36_74]